MDTAINVNNDGRAADSQVIAMSWFTTLSLACKPVLAFHRRDTTERAVRQGRHYGDKERRTNDGNGEVKN